eukprot:gene8428-21661_t
MKDVILFPMTAGTTLMIAALIVVGNCTDLTGEGSGDTISTFRPAVDGPLEKHSCGTRSESTVAHVIIMSELSGETRKVWCEKCTEGYEGAVSKPGGFIVDDGVVLLEDCVSCSNGFMCSPSAEECTSCVNVPTLAPVDSTYRPVTTCTESEFACWNGRDSVEDGCISAGDVCDKVNDCGDNSDENGCPDSASDCQRNEFACLGGVFQDSILRFACIDMDYVCDGNNDCGDNTDEFGCPDIVEPNHPDIDRASVCKRSEFQCTSGVFRVFE